MRTGYARQFGHAPGQLQEHAVEAGVFFVEIGRINPPRL